MPHRVLDNQLTDTARFTRREIAFALNKSERQIQRDLDHIQAGVSPYERFTRRRFLELCRQLVQNEKAK